jgi:hypothetical protein
MKRANGLLRSSTLQSFDGKAIDPQPTDNGRKMRNETESVPLRSLNTFLSVCHQSYNKCIDVVEHQHVIKGIVAKTRLHHLKFDGNGQPMIEALAEHLYNHIIDYCIASRNRPTPLTPQAAAKLTKEARKLFIHPPASEEDPDQTGEAGETLLYFLVEAVLCAPQVVAKMELKTNRRDEVKGSDGIHMCWNEQDQLVDLYFGEAKLYQDIGTAMTAALKSVDDFHKNDMRRHEFSMVTKYFKYADEKVQKTVVDLIGAGVPTGNVRINHACLIGYNWSEYGKLPRNAAANLREEFRKRYIEDSPRLLKLLQSRFDNFPRKQLRFELFLLPFPTVQEFRDAFNKALD